MSVPATRETSYIYTDAAGAPLLRVLRIQTAEGKTFAQFHAEDGRWVKGGLPITPLLNLTALAAQPNAPVLVVEGEKTAHAAVAYAPEGWLVTTWPGGSGAVGKVDWAPLHGRRVAIWPDYDLKAYPKEHKLAGKLLPPDDQPGRKAARKIAAAVPGAAIVGFLPEVIAAGDDGWDLADPLPAGLKRSDVMFAILEAVEPKAAPESTAEPTPAPTPEPTPHPRPEPSPRAADAPPVPEVDAHALIAELAHMKSLDYGRARKGAAKVLGVPVTLLDREVTKARLSEGGLNGAASKIMLAANGSILPIFTNAAEVIRCHREVWPLRFDEFSQRPFLGEEPLCDADLQRVAEWVQRQGVLANRRTIDDAVMYVASQNKFHPVREYLDSLEWDGIPRADHLLIDHAGAEDDDKGLNRAFTGKWLIQSAARIYEPGCHARATLVLEGSQDIGKSTIFREIFGDRWFTDHLPDLTSKDALLQLRGIWCVEIAELATLGRSDSARIKQFLTSRVDRYRDPYGRVVADYPRTCVFGGTVNPGARGYLKDETGGTRFWPIAVTAVDIQAIRSKRDQVWAEIVHRFRAGEQWHLGDEHAAAARDVQDEKYEGDPWNEKISEFVSVRDTVAVGDIFRMCLNIPSEADWNQIDMNRISRCLSQLKWTRKQIRDGNKRRWVYSAPVTPEDPEQPSLGL